MKAVSSVQNRARILRLALYRKAVCEAAECLFADRGIDETKVEEIAREAGISIATLYSVFDAGKAQIVRSVHENHLDELVAFVVRASADTRPDPRSRPTSPSARCRYRARRERPECVGTS